MVAAMMRSEDDQILAMTNFLKSGKMHIALERRDWTAFALAYIGPTFAKNRYDARLADAYARFSASGLPDLDARAVQLFLLYHGFDPGLIDGVVGAKTKSAIAAFCAKQGNAIPKAVDSELLQILRDALPAAPDG
jgi:peptidoglycan hydrolase-like protein with peptidoglycan-binding domain